MRRPAISSVFVLACAGVLMACHEADKEPDGQGTEIGDEGGGWYCSDEVSAVADPEAAIAGFSTTPADALALVDGSFSGDGMSMSMDMLLDEVWLYDAEPEDVHAEIRASTPEPECVDRVFMSGILELSAADLYLWTELAVLSVSEAGVVALGASAIVYENFQTDLDDDESGSDEGSWTDTSQVDLDIAPTTFDYADMEQVELVVTGTPTASGWELEGRLIGTTVPQGEDADILTLEEVIFTRSVEAD